MRRFFLMMVPAMMVVFGGFTASAQSLDSVHRDWSVFTIQQNGKKVCYMASTPKNKTGNYSRRDEPYLLVTHISNSVDEVSTSSGYPYGRGTEAKAEIDGKEYNMFTKGELAWAYDSKQDTEMVSAMKRGSEIKIRGTSSKGTYSLDTYSLMGFTKAYGRVKALCK